MTLNLQSLAVRLEVVRAELRYVHRSGRGTEFCEPCLAPFKMPVRTGLEMKAFKLVIRGSPSECNVKV